MKDPLRRAPKPSPDDEATGSLSRDPSDPPGNRGVRKPTFEAEDEQEAAEELTEIGVEAAEDEQENAARSRFPAA
jgi:hypothetical protein